ncbi:MAG: acetyl-CoA carboxylase biotin carboxylase subunit, partial [Bdellovibrionales bacterium]|nr:acetyl-CoA carboxylase biotin carboxylase subunit [Bdellovibrionales bacterium]
VECPVTEMILGIDLIRAQVLTAQGLSPFIQKKFIPRGHSIQCRIYAEDMQKQVPDFGPLGTCEFPQGVNRRFDMGYESEDQVPGFYDAMLGKCIVWEESRLRAIEKMKKALSDILIFGLKTNLSFLQDLISHTAFREGKTHTRFVEEMFLPFWKEKEIHALPPEVIFTLLKTFSAQTKSVSFHKKEKHFNPWAYFSK